MLLILNRVIWMGKMMNFDDFDQFVIDYGVCYIFKRSEIDGKVFFLGKRILEKKIIEIEKNLFEMI